MTFAFNICVFIDVSVVNDFTLFTTIFLTKSKLISLKHTSVKSL